MALEPTITSFTEKTEEFLSEYAVIVGDESQHDGAKPPGLAKFYMKKGERNLVTLVRRGFTGPKDGLVQAYWLPWKSHAGVAMDLGTEADWLFTSEMTNCRFTILTENDVAVKVAHIAGDLSRQNREACSSGLVTNPATQRTRSLSVTGNDILYQGQGKTAADGSSAFVFGRREQGVWKFYAQVVGGFRTVGNTKNLADNITILTQQAAI